MKFAAIDVGSNAVRLLLSRVIEDGRDPIIKKESLVRMPIRLGEDAFIRHRICQARIEQLIDTMVAFKFLIKAYQPLDFMACATSAMREAENRFQIREIINKHSDINLEIVDGRREAEIIYANRIEQMLEPRAAYLYIDVGGGSTELTLLQRGRSLASRSFDIGTIRLLKGLVSDKTWDGMKKWLKRQTRGLDPIFAIGSGGNINKIFRLSGRNDRKKLSYGKIDSIYRGLLKYSWEERIRALGLRPDRADVIVPAAEIYLSVLKWAGIKAMHVPQIGLPDGMVRILYDKYRNRR